MAYSKSYSNKPKYQRRKTTRNTKPVNELKVYVDPFNAATTNPKIPDGKCRLSSGLRLQAVKEFQNNTEGDMDFILYPGLNGGMTVARASNTGVDKVMPYSSHGTLAVNGAAVNQIEGGVIAQWRLVSQAARLTLINNSDENDGWWEAIRFANAADANQFTLNDNTIAPETVETLPAGPGTIQAKIGNMVEHPSYCTGKLRDIHRYVFQLKPHDTAHDFTKLQGNYPNENAQQLLEFKESLIDSSYDMIFIRVHARPSSTDGFGATRLMAHVVSNQEVMYEPSTTLARYHTETNAARSLTNNVKDAIMHAGNKAAYKKQK